MLSNARALSSLGAILLQILSASAATVAKRAPEPWSNYVKNPIFYPSQDAASWRSIYARSIQLPDKSLLLTWEDYDPTVEQPYWPIYKSLDGGASFQNFSRVHDQVNGWGVWYNPNLYTLPQDFGGYPAGTILIAGESLPKDFSEAYIDIYASTDEGLTWSFLSHIVYGPGPETTTNGNKAVWEPFLMMYDDQLVCFYSTQVDPKHAQKLAHKTTADLKNWSEEVNDVANPDYNERPGMTTVAYSPKSQKYIMTYERCGEANVPGCPVHFKVSSSPLTFDSEPGVRLLPSNGGAAPDGSPYIIWTPNLGSADGCGTFIASGNAVESIFVNIDGLDPNGWKALNVGMWSAYSRFLNVIDTPEDSAAKGEKKLFIANGGNMGCTGSCYNFVADALVDVPTYPAT
ncbi:hypothetical protein IFR04_003623 [Cadophora malorum]|uniref:Glycoside hydrolase family 93 protein n=1 Tax=Cadophora malorum TaxID=108018 RepID=A0A8H7WEB5_9HELO|nr:hypothetical protein IFR04_003623 [Cadophora malorum]